MSARTALLLAFQLVVACDEGKPESPPRSEPLPAATAASEPGPRKPDKPPESPKETFPPARAPRKFQVPEGIVEFDFAEMSAAEVAEAVGPIAGEEVAVDPALEGAYGCRRFSFVRKRVVTPDPAAAAKLLETADLGLRRVDGWWVVGPGPALSPCAPPTEISP